MTDQSPHASDAARALLVRRYAAERRFRRAGASAIALALGALVLLLGVVGLRGFSGFVQHTVTLPVHFDAETLGVSGVGPDALSGADFGGLVKQTLRAEFPEVSTRSERRELYGLVSNGAAFALRDRLAEDPSLLGRTTPVSMLLSDDADLYFKGRVRADLPAAERRLSDSQLRWLARFDADGRVHGGLHLDFLRRGDSREPEMAGVWGAVVGTTLTLLVTLLVSFPIGVSSAVYLEEFAPRNRWTDLIEVNINNLAAVPSIVFGLLGLAVFLNFFGMPRSAPVVGGLVLSLMTLPVVIIGARSAIASVPPSIREAALGVGASRLQVVTQHVLPLALPGILTGTILGMARALGETAPLLMIGMVAFIVDVPTGFTSPATVLPVQIYLWADSPERAFVDKTSAAILVLLVFLVVMNLLAVLLRNRFERRW